MEVSVSMKLKAIFQTARQWLSDTPQRSLDRAYRAALEIKEIEDKHFNGQKVSAESSDYGNSVLSYFQSEVKRYLTTAKMRLAAFKASRLFLSISEFKNGELSAEEQKHILEEQAESSKIIDQLTFIDEVIHKYEIDDFKEAKYSNSLIEYSQESRENQSPEASNNQNKKNNSSQKINQKKKPISSLNKNRGANNLETVSDKTSVLPRSFLRTLNRIKQEVDPKSQETEEEVLNKFRKSRNKTAISIKFMLILIIVPLLSHQISKTFLITPIVEHYFTEHAQIIFVNSDLEEKAFMELHNFEERIHFRSLIGLAPEISQAEIEEKLKDKASKIAQNYRHQGADAIANIFADMFSLFAFALIVWTSKKEILIVKSFLDEILYNLSDSAKAFLIILVTDMFVGYHSPHGWEVILEGISRHLGLPENREFNFLFIATFPVILDTVLKYWIFRYLNRISPSSVATYKNMNE